MKTVREQLQIFTRRFGLLNAACCDDCCGEQISMVQSHILMEIRRTGSPSMQQVAEELGMDITTFSRQVKTLEIKGLVSRRVSQDDRRVTLLGLTAAGLETVGKIDTYMSARLVRIFGQLSPFERDTVVRSLELLNGVLIQERQETISQGGTIACCK